MHILKNLSKIPFWIDYYMQDFWMKRKLNRLNRINEDFTKDEAKQQTRMLKYCRRAYPDFYKFYGLDGSEALEQYPIVSKHDMREHPDRKSVV